MQKIIKKVMYAFNLSVKLFKIKALIFTCYEVLK